MTSTHDHELASWVICIASLSLLVLSSAFVLLGEKLLSVRAHAWMHTHAHKHARMVLTNLYLSLCASLVTLPSKYTHE